jgi:heme exporter protein CcmD
MDKYGAYVIITYAVTFVILVGYLAWVWARLSQERGREKGS